VGNRLEDGLGGPESDTERAGRTGCMGGRFASLAVLSMDKFDILGSCNDDEEGWVTDREGTTRYSSFDSSSGCCESVDVDEAGSPFRTSEDILIISLLTFEGMDSTGWRGVGYMAEKDRSDHPLYSAHHL